jgi:hypothetical protein
MRLGLRGLGRIGANKQPHSIQIRTLNGHGHVIAAPRSISSARRQTGAR